MGSAPFPTKLDPLEIQLLTTSNHALLISISGADDNFTRAKRFLHGSMALGHAVTQPSGVIPGHVMYRFTDKGDSLEFFTEFKGWVVPEDQAVLAAAHPSFSSNDNSRKLMREALRIMEPW